MKKLIINCIIFIAAFTACEEVYYPEIDDVGSAIVVDARIVYGESDNYIVLTESNGFNDDSNDYPAVTDANVSLLDNEGNVFELPEHAAGEFYVNVNLDSERQYKIIIQQGENTFESDFERVPDTPTLDSVYGFAETNELIVGGETDADNISQIAGIQIYGDMISTPETPNYRFTAKKVLEFVWEEERGQLLIPHYYWTTTNITGLFNIASTPEYSSSKEIKKHPLFFVPQKVNLEPDSIMIGWILVMYQYGISESAYDYYSDLNSQLDSEGRIFDPIYVQARNNIECVNNPTEIILGNFEISNVSEHRYFIRFISEKQGYVVREISDRSSISWSGETIDVPPDFWVNLSN